MHISILEIYYLNKCAIVHLLYLISKVVDQRGLVD